MIEFHAFPRVGAEPPQDAFLTQVKAAESVAIIASAM
jgi:hypothetical protein